MSVRIRVRLLWTRAVLALGLLRGRPTIYRVHVVGAVDAWGRPIESAECHFSGHWS